MRKSLFGIRVVASPCTRVAATRVAAFALALVFAAQASAAQTTKELTVVGRLTPTVEAGGARGGTRGVVTGDATVQAQPDTAILTVAVVTQNASASEAQSENASKTDAVVRALKAAAGPGAEVKTSGYSLQPQYAYKEGAPPTITAYVARNAVNVTTASLDRVGALIDAAARAGANNVEGLAFTLRRDETA